MFLCQIKKLKPILDLLTKLWLTVELSSHLFGALLSERKETIKLIISIQAEPSMGNWSAGTPVWKDLQLVYCSTVI